MFDGSSSHDNLRSISPLVSPSTTKNNFPSLSFLNFAFRFEDVDSILNVELTSKLLLESSSNSKILLLLFSLILYPNALAEVSMIIGYSFLPLVFLPVPSLLRSIVLTAETLYLVFLFTSKQTCFMVLFFSTLSIVKL